jgi:hypothetical protein
MNARSLSVYALLAGLLLLSGCQPLKENREVDLAGHEAKPILFSAPRYDQKLTVEAHSPGKPVSVYLVKDADTEKTVNALLNGKTPAGALASQEKAEDVSFTGTVPAGTDFALVVFNPGKDLAKVKLKVTGR